MLFQFYKIQIHKRDANLEGADFSREISDFKSHFIGTKINAYTDGVRPNDPPTLYENRIYRDKVTGDLVLMQLCSNKKVSKTINFQKVKEDTHPFCNLLFDLRPDSLLLAIEKSGAFDRDPDAVRDLVQEFFKHLIAPQCGYWVTFGNMVRPIDFFERTLANTWVLEKGDVRIFGLYNWNERETLKIDYPAAYAGLEPEKEYVGFDFWQNEFVKPFKGELKAELPPSSCRAIACVPAEDHPVLVSTSRHVASPVFDVENVEWEDNESWWRWLIWGKSVLRGESKVVAGDRYELRLYVPAGWRVWGWSPDPERTQVLSAKGPFVRLAFVPEKTGVIRWHVAFEKE